MNAELQHITRTKGYQNETPTDFPEVILSAKSKFNPEIDALVKTWRIRSEQFAQTDREESDFKEGCCFKAYENRYVVCPAGTLITGAGFAATVVGGTLRATLPGAEVLMGFGLVSFPLGFFVALSSCGEQNDRELDDYRDRKSTVELEKSRITKCVNFLNSVSELFEKWNHFPRDLSEKTIIQLFTVFENVQNAEIKPLAIKAKIIEKLFFMEDIVRTLHIHKACTEIVKIWETFKSSPPTSWGGSHLIQSLEKFGLSQLPPSSYLNFFIGLPFYSPSEAQVCKKISAAQLYVKSIAA